MISDVVLGGLTKAMETLSNQIREAISFAETAQKSSLALGMTFQQTRTQLGSTMEGLRGDMNQRFGAAIMGLEAGMQGNTAGVAKLINQQQLTGTSFAKTATAVAVLESSLGLSRDTTNILSENLLKTGAEYAISTDKLVDAIDALKSTFPAQALAGMGSNVMEAVTLLQAELGPQLAGPLQSVMKMIMDTSMEGYERLVKLGIGDSRERLSASRSTAEAFQIFKDAVVTASDSFKSVAGDASKGFFQIGVASEVFGQQTIDFTTVADNFGKRVKTENDAMEDFGNQLSVLKSEILQPLTDTLSKFYPIILKSFQALSASARKVVERFSTFLEGTLPKADKVFKEATLAVIDFAIFGLNQFDRFRKYMGVVIDDVFPKIKDAFISVNTAIHYGIIVPIELVKMTFTSLMQSLDMAYAAFLLAAKGLLELMDSLQVLGDWTEEIKDVDKALNDFGQRTLERTNDFFDSVNTIASDPAKTAAELSKKLKDINDDPNLLGNKYLSDIRDQFERGDEIQREQNKHLKEINAKTPEIATTPEFLDETANMLGRSIEAILGVGRDTTAAEMLEELKLANEQRAAQGDKNPSSMIDTGS